MKVRFETNLGIIILELDVQRASATVDNFTQYVSSGHYDGTIFHRVIKDFMIQGGGFDADMRAKPTRPSIRNEANNGLCNELGAISMARTTQPHTAAAQFFINTDDNPNLDFQEETQEGWGYCVFGKVLEGMETVYAIEGVATTRRAGYEDVPEKIITLTTAKLLPD